MRSRVCLPSVWRSHRLDTESVATIVEAVEHASSQEITTGESDVAVGQLMDLLHGRQ
jgi:hypothetical protein